MVSHEWERRGDRIELVGKTSFEMKDDGKQSGIRTDDTSILQKMGDDRMYIYTNVDRWFAVSSAKIKLATFRKDVTCTSHTQTTNSRSMRAWTATQNTI